MKLLTNTEVHSAAADTILLSLAEGPRSDVWRRGEDRFWYRPGDECGYDTDELVAWGPFVTIR